MDAVFGLLVLLLGVSHGVETHCDGRQNGAVCFGPLGGTVVFRLMDDASKIFRYDWKKGDTTILQGRKDMITNNQIESRSSFTPSNGTFRINDLSRNDVGDYTLEFFVDSSGFNKATRTLQLNIQGVETHCDGRQNGAVCFGPLGGTVVFRLMDDASKIFRYGWKKGETNILQGREEKFITNQITNRSSFTPSDGTLRINDLSRNDGGEYTLELFFDSSGSNKAKQTLQLNIQVPVSSVRLTSECLSEGEKRVSCSSQEGDSPQYSWTLNGRTLSNSQLLSGNSESQNITLKQDQSGPLACTVRNQVTSVTKEEQISTCGFQFFDCTLLNGTYITKWLLPTNETQCIQSTTLSGGKETVTITPSIISITFNYTTLHQTGLPLLMNVLRAAVVILVLVGTVVYFAWKKRKSQKAEGSADFEMSEYENDSVIIAERRTSPSEL
ncbi:uncharacterized protein LOC121516758 [Cheilinus undulatus]|uniref:uncharacterized protein LOC121516758 n=1 Tax=Cheilinus undulatus TaxID=241271 RepID=UPI001BD2017D|nr:uncharacterized protein LOC121516758 [Cheilinus undulatus]